MAEKTDLDALPRKMAGKVRDSRFAPMLNGGVWRLKKGIDFTKLHSIRACAYNYASVYGYTMQSRTDGDDLLIQFTKKPVEGATR